VKKNIGLWRKKILKDNSLLAAVQLPDELFQPYLGRKQRFRNAVNDRIGLEPYPSGYP
jgi:hypothetical protein